MGKKTPEAPDYRGAAEEQGQASLELTREQTRANRPDRINPWGSETWQEPTTPGGRWTQTVNVAPELQDSLNAQFNLQRGRSELANQMLGRVGQEIGGAMDWSQFGDPRQGPDAIALNDEGLPTLQGDIARGVVDAPTLQRGVDLSGANQVADPRFQTSLGLSNNALRAQNLQRELSTEGLRELEGADTIQRQLGDVGGPQRSLDFSGLDPLQASNQYRDSAEQALYDRSTRFMDERFAQDEAALRERLRNQGFVAGDEAYDRQMADFNRNREAAYEGARQQAIIGSGAEASRLFNMDLDRRQQMAGEIGQAGMFGNQAQQQAYQQMLNSGMFGNQAQQQAFNQSLAARQSGFNERQAQGDFANRAALDAFGMDRDVRQQEVADRLAEGNFANQARQSQLNADLARRQQTADEAFRQADFANRASQQQYGLDQAVQDNRFNQDLAAANLANQARRQGADERFRWGDYTFGQQQQAANAANQLRQSQIAEEMTRRGFSLNEVNALLTGQQVNNPQFQSFNQAARAETPQYLAAADMGYQADLDATNARNAGIQGLMSGAAQMYSSGMFCDRRLKRNIKRIGEFKGYPLYSFTYVWGEDAVGVMSDEVNPEAVIKHESGFDMVIYDAIR